jgi:hypothetical protein
MAKKLLSADAARAWLRRRYDAQQRAWLTGAGSWPLGVPLGDPTEKTVADDPRLVREWVDAWSRWNDGGEVQWIERQWPRLGQLLGATVNAEPQPRACPATTPVPNPVATAEWRDIIELLSGIDLGACPRCGSQALRREPLPRRPHEARAPPKAA